MSSRRTRSGALLVSSEPRRLRSTPVRKLQEAKFVEETRTPLNTGLGSQHDTSYNTTLDLSSGESAVEKNTKSKQESPKKVQLSCSNIWERLAKNDGELLCGSIVKTTVNETCDIASGKAATVLKERSSTADSVTSKKNRKPEILVSLLEGEAAYPINHRKDIAGFSSSSSNSYEEVPDISNKAIEKSFLTVGTAGKCTTEESSDTYLVSPSVCFFHNCDSHRNDSLADFSSMPDVPGEPFFVSLSNDENKELNMVKTSSGTVRVGCSLRKFADHNHNYTESCSKSSIFTATEKSRKIRNLNEVASAEHKIGKRSAGRCLYSSDVQCHKSRLDENKEHVWSHQSENDHDSELRVVEHKSTISKRMGLENMNSENMTSSSKASWNQEVNRVESTSTNFQPLSQIAPDKKRISEITLRSETAFKRSDINISTPYKSLTPCRSSQYPLMKEILIQQNFLPLSTAAPIAKFVGLDSEVSDNRHLKSVDTFKSSCKSLVSLPSVLSPENSLENSPESKNVVKRSERIRCKSGMGKPCGITLHQSVISTMKPADKSFKPKSKTPSSKRNCNIYFGREPQRKKSKKMCDGVKKTTVMNGSNDSQKKTTMSREVMEAIIQSIEETVSGCSGEDKNKDIPDLETINSSSTSCATNHIPHESDSNIASTSRISVMVDHCLDSTTDHDYDISTNSAHLSHISKSVPVAKDRIMSSSSKKTQKLFSTKKSARKTKKTCKAGNKMKTLKVRSAKSKTKSLTITTTIEDRPSSVTSIYSTAESPANDEVDASGAGTTILSTTGKRFRKKTRKAKEAFGDDDVFCDEYWSVKKSKSRNRSCSTSSDSNSSSQRRSRRSSQLGRHIADPVLEEHAFILWASENRSQLEQQHPGVSSAEIDTILFSRWCEITDTVKAKFFLRAREAFSDDDRSTFHSSSMTDLEASMFGDFFSESDPIFTEFIRLPIDRQRDMLRKWLKFFQQTLAKKEYIDFIVTFKRACNRDTSSAGRTKRTRMRCLDPSHYKMLFDMIRLTKPRVLEVYKTMQDQDKSTVSDTYSIILLKLVRNEPLPLMEPGCRSHILTEVLQDLGIPDNSETSPKRSLCASVIGCSTGDNINRENLFITNDIDCKIEARKAAESTTTTLEWRKNLDAVSKVTLEIRTDSTGSDSNFDETDYSLLNSDLALGLLSGLSEMSELPILDQDTLDQIFLAPPRMSTSFNQQRRAVNLYGRRVDTLPQNLIPLVSRPSTCAPLCIPRLLPTDQVSYPKINIHYSSNTVPSSGNIVHHLPLKYANSLPYKYNRRDTRNSSPVRGGWCRKNLPIDVHNNISSMENMIQSPAHFNGPHSKCFKVHAKVMPPQIKLNLQPLQLPINARSHQQNKLHPRFIPVSCGLQQRFPTIIYSPTNPTLLDKLGPHHISQLATQPMTSSSATSSRMSAQPIGLNNPSPLITSLSPLRSVKYNHSSKSYSPQCQMVPYRPRMQLMAGSSSCHRRTAHTIPISTTHKTCNPRGHGNLQQIKVCLSTQTLKIPIAKLRESRKTSYIKGKVKNFNMQPNSLEPYGNLPCTQACQFNVRANPPSSVLAKVLNFQAVNDMEHLTKMSLADGLCNNTVSTSRPVNSTFIGTMRPVTVQPVSTSLRSTTQLHLVSMASTPSCSADIKTTGSNHAAMVVNPLNINRSCHVTQSSCIATTVHSISDYSSCSFTGVNVANSHAISTQSVHMVGGNTCISAKNFNHWENRVCSRANVISERSYTNSLFHEFADINSGDFRVVGTRTVGTAETAKETTSDNSDSTLEAVVQDSSGLSVYPPSGCSDITASLLECSETSVKKRFTEDLKGFDKTIVSKAKGLELFVRGYNHEKGKDEIAPIVTSAAASYNSQCILSDNLLNCEVVQLSTTQQTSPKSCVISSDHKEDTVTHECVSTDTNHKQGTAVVHSCRDSLSVPSSCGLTSSQSYLSKMFVADTSLVTKDIPWQCKCVICTSGMDKSCSPSTECDSHVYVSNVQKAPGGDQHEQMLSSLDENCNTQDDCDNKSKKIITGDCIVTVSSVLKSIENLPVNVCPTSTSISCNNSNNRNTGPCTYSGMTINNGIQQSSLENTDNINSLTLDKNSNAVCLSKLGGNRDFCEHEYSIGNSCPTRNMVKCIGTVPVCLPSSCTSGTSGLHILAETATSARSLLSSRRFVRPSSQTTPASDDNWLSRKQDCVEIHDAGPTVKKMTMCAVTVQSDTGCILVENLASKEKNINQLQRTNLDLLTSSSNSCTAATLPISPTNNVDKFTYDPCSVTVNVTQSLSMQQPARTTVIPCTSAHNNVVVTLNKTSHISSTVTHSPTSAGHKRAHYIHKYLPT